MEDQQREISCSEALLEATRQCMEADESVFIIGEGVPDPKGIFGTTVGLREKFGSSRVKDMPVSENGLTGMCIGAALSGLRPILTHQRIDFTLYSFDQIINNAAKWHYMFAGKGSVPLVIRMVIGRGWGQGAQHSQNIQALFAHIPGLTVVMPATARDAKGLLISSIESDNPVLFIEHRWVHYFKEHVPREMYRVPIGKARIAREGADITIVSSSYMVIESLKAADFLKEQGISCEVVDLRTIKPLDMDTVKESVAKTGKVLVVDSGYQTGGIAGEIIAQLCCDGEVQLKSKPSRLTLPDIPTPTSTGLTKHYYFGYEEICRRVMDMLDKKDVSLSFPQRMLPHDVPDKSFTGPF